MDTEYNIELLLQVKDEFSKELKKVKDSIDEVEKKVSDTHKTTSSAVSSIKSMLKTLGVTALFATATKEIMNGVNSIVEYESAIKRLQILTQNSSGATQGQVNALIQQAEALDKVGVATKESIVAAQSQLATFDLSTKAIETLTPAIADYVIAEKGATASAEDFRQMTNGLAQALDGNYASLTRTGFILDEETKHLIETGTEAQKVAAIVKVLESTYKGFNEEVARSTIEGQMIMTRKAFDDVTEAIASALMPAIKDAYGEFEELFNQATEWVEVHQLEIQAIADTVVDVLGVIVDTAQTVVGNISDMLNTLGELISKVTGDAGKDSEGTMQVIKGDFSDVIYYFEQGVNVVSGAVNMIVAAFKSGFNTIGNYLSAMTQTYLRTVQNVVNGVIQGINWVKEKTGLGDLIKEVDLGVGTYADIWGDAFDDTVDAATESWNDIKEAWNKMTNNMVNTYAERVGQIEAQSITFKSFDKTTEDTTRKSSGLSSSASSSSSKAAKQAADDIKALAKEMQEYGKETENIRKKNQQFYKELNDEADYILDKQKKVIEELNKEYQEKFDDLTDKIEDAADKMKSLGDEVESLNKKMKDLTTDENKSIAGLVVEARKEIAELDKEYEGLRAVAQSVSSSDLVGKGYIGGFDTDLIKKYKEYMDEVNSMYEGMDAAERKALDSEIEYAERYDSLNGVQKIKEDYKKRKDEVQDELDKKLEALDAEQGKLITFTQERDTLQAERMNKIQEEYDKREDLYKDKKRFEEEYMSMLATNHLAELKMTDNLISKWNAVAEAKRQAMSAGSGIDGARANGGPVLSGNTYLVGERGPELFVPSSSGRIVPNNEITNNNGVSINLSGITVREDADIDRITDEIIRKIKLEKTFGIS